MQDSFEATVFRTNRTYKAIEELVNDTLIVVAKVPYHELVIQNDTNKVLIINVNQYEVHGVKPGETVIKAPWYTYNSDIIVRARYNDENFCFEERFNTRGGSEALEAKGFNYSTFRELEDREWRIVIPAIE
jgi:hypothetical protein